MCTPSPQPPWHHVHTTSMAHNLHGTMCTPSPQPCMWRWNQQYAETSACIAFILMPKPALLALCLHSCCGSFYSSPSIVIVFAGNYKLFKGRVGGEPSAALFSFESICTASFFLQLLPKSKNAL